MTVMVHLHFFSQFAGISIAWLGQRCSIEGYIPFAWQLTHLHITQQDWHNHIAPCTQSHSHLACPSKQ
jgi:hypothetical protein